jgi:hypothetical protein
MEAKQTLQNAVCSLPTTDVVNNPIKAQKRTADHFLNDDPSIYHVDLQSVTEGKGWMLCTTSCGNRNPL